MRSNIAIRMKDGIIKLLYIFLLIRLCIRYGIYKENSFAFGKINYKILKDLKNDLPKRGVGAVQKLCNQKNASANMHYYNIDI